MDADGYAQDLVMMVSKTIGLHLDTLNLGELKATQMITRDVMTGDKGTMYYVKVKTVLKDWPWVFVKIFEPPIITDASPVTFKGMKKMVQDFELVTF